MTCPKLNVPLASVYTLENKHQSPESEPCARVTWPSISNLLPIWTLFTVLLCSHNNYCQRWRSPPKKCKYGSKKLTCMVIFLMRTGWNFNSPTLDGVTTTYICIVLIFKAYFILIFFLFNYQPTSSIIGFVHKLDTVIIWKRNMGGSLCCIFHC